MQSNNQSTASLIAAPPLARLQVFLCTGQSSMRHCLQQYLKILHLAHVWKRASSFSRLSQDGLEQGDRDNSYSFFSAFSRLVLLRCICSMRCLAQLVGTTAVCSSHFGESKMLSMISPDLCSGIEPTSIFLRAFDPRNGSSPRPSIRPKDLLSKLTLRRKLGASIARSIE